MYKIVKPLFLVNETPMHAGSGDSLGVVDLPIQRERHTQFPKIEASSLKGALRQAFEQQDGTFTLKEKTEKVNQKPKDQQQRSHIEHVFGPENTGNDSFQGAIGFSDARLLLFPVKAMRGVFAWITCPKVLRQLERDLQLVYGREQFALTGLNKDLSDGCWVNTGNEISVQASRAGDAHVVLEEYTFPVKGQDVVKVKVGDAEPVALGQWLVAQGLMEADSYWGEKLQQDVVVLSDSDFADFVNMTTEVITRTRIDHETGTVARTGLFTEEYLPAESVLYSLLLVSPVFQPKEKLAGALLQTAEDVMSFFQQGLPEVFQLGGNATLGKGLLRTQLLTSSPSPQPTETTTT